MGNIKTDIAQFVFNDEKQHYIKSYEKRFSSLTANEFKNTRQYIFEPPFFVPLSSEMDYPPLELTTLEEWILRNDGDKTYNDQCYQLTKELLNALLIVHNTSDALGFITIKSVLVDEQNKVWFSEWAALSKQPIPTSDLMETTISNFIAPELVNKEEFVYNVQSDQYSLGVLLYELFTKLNPFGSEKGLDTIYKHKTLVPDLPTHYNKGMGSSMAEFIMKLLNKNPENRFENLENVIVTFKECYELFQNDRLELNLKNKGTARKVFRLNATSYLFKANLHHFHRAFDEMISKGVASICFIEGKNGVQKTQFIQTFANKVAKENTLFISANLKVDEQIPLSSIKEIIKEISNYYLTLPDEEVNNFKVIVNSRLGLAISVIQELYPEIVDIIPMPVVKSTTKGFELKSQLIFAVAEFLKAVIDTNKVLIIHFKGVHFGTKNTLDFLVEVLKEFPLKELFFIFSYEKGKLNNSQEEFILKNGFRKSGQLLFSEISLKNLIKEEIVELLKNSQVDPHQIDFVAEVLHSKTNGLPRFIDEITQTLLRGKKIFYDESSQHWQIVNQALLQSSNYVDDIPGLYQRKIQALSEDVRQMLKLAAMIGDTFPVTVLQKIYSQPAFDSAFEELINKGFFTKIDSGKFSFVDDTIPNLMKKNISENEIATINSIILKAFQEQVKTIEKSEFFNLFLSKIIEIREFENETLWLEKGIGLAMRIADFGLAYKYSTYLAEKENKEDWRTNRSEVFKRRINQLNIAALNLKFDEASRLYADLKQKQLNDLEEIKLENTYSEALLNDLKYNQSIKNASKTLRKFNLGVSQNPSIARIIISSIRMTMLMKGKNWEYFQNLEPMQDPSKIALINLIQIMVGPAFIVNPKMIPELIFRQMSLGEKYGFSIHLGVSIGCYAFLNANFQKKYKEAKEMFQLAAKVDELSQNNGSFLVNKFMYNSFVQPWFTNFTETKKSLIEGFRLCRQSGMGSIAFYNFNFIVQIMLTCEERITDLESELKEILIYLKENTPKNGDDIFLVTLHYFKCLGYKSEDSLLEEYYDFDIFEIVERAKKQDGTGLPLKLSNIYRIQIYLSFINEEYEINDKDVKTTLSILTSQGNGYYMVPLFQYYTALNYIKSRNSKHYKKQIKQAIKSLTEASEVMPENYRTKVCFLEGLYDISLGNKESGIFKLQKAYHLAVENKELMTEGLIARELAYCYEKEGMESQKNFFFKQAIAHFDNYKATNLSKKIIDRYPQFSVEQKSSLNINQKINLQSFISASTSIAAEIKLETLLEKMMVILAENAGAEKVLFIVPTVNNFEIVASKNKEELTVNKSKVTQSQVPVSILNYVKRTQKHVLLESAIKDSRYKNDVYINKNNILSVLCIPVIKNLQLLGIIYFENNLIQNAFTEENSQTLKLLASQIAISFENSQLYNHMEKLVEERTQKLNESLHTLRTTQKQLIQNEKLASLGELTAGIAHEIQNPLNFVNNFSEVSSEMLDELKEEIESDHKNDALELIDDLKGNLKKINHHGNRASSIVKGMLEHSRTSAGKKELININALADEYLRLSYHGLRAKNRDFNAIYDTDLQKDLPLVRCGAQDIGRVLLNIINNAFQSPSNSKNEMKRVNITTRSKYDEIEIVISDNGAGIPQEIKDKIFQPFFTTKPTGQGTGLGLSLSYDIITAMHNGSIEVQSNPNKGTKFIITLPVNK